MKGFHFGYVLIALYVAGMIWNMTRPWKPLYQSEKTQIPGPWYAQAL